MVSNEVAMLERTEEGLQSNELQPRGDGMPETNRLFIRNFDEGKLYTNRYVRRLKAAHKKLMDKFTLGSKYALTA